MHKSRLAKIKLAHLPHNYVLFSYQALHRMCLKAMRLSLKGNWKMSPLTAQGVVRYLPSYGVMGERSLSFGKSATIDQKAGCNGFPFMCRTSSALHSDNETGRLSILLNVAAKCNNVGKTKSIGKLLMWFSSTRRTSSFDIRVNVLGKSTK
jgi:hypothetical protein